MHYSAGVGNAQKQPLIKRLLTCQTIYYPIFQIRHLNKATHPLQSRTIFQIQESSFQPPFFLGTHMNAPLLSSLHFHVTSTPNVCHYYSFQQINDFCFNNEIKAS